MTLRPKWIGRPDDTEFVPLVVSLVSEGVAEICEEDGTPCEVTLPGGGGPVLFPVWNTEAGLLGGNQTIYCYIGGSHPAITSTESYTQIRMPACNVLAISGNNYSAVEYVLTVRKNAGDTAMTSGTVTSQQDHFRLTTGAPVAFADGDLLSIEVDIPPGGGAGFRGLFLEIGAA